MIKVSDVEEMPVSSLVDGDLFSLDGCVWYSCARVLFGSVAVYATLERGAAAPTRRVDAARDARCHVLVEAVAEDDAES